MLPRYLDWYRIHGVQFSRCPVILYWSTLDESNGPSVRITAFPEKVTYPAIRWVVINLCQPFQLHAYYENSESGNEQQSRLLIGHYIIPWLPTCPSGSGLIRVGIQLDNEGKFSIFRIELIDNRSGETDTLSSSVAPLNSWVETSQGNTMALEFQLHPVPLTADEVGEFLHISKNKSIDRDETDDTEKEFAKMTIDELIRQIRSKIDDKSRLIGILTTEELYQIRTLLEDSQILISKNTDDGALHGRLKELCRVQDLIEQRMCADAEETVSPEMDNASEENYAICTSIRQYLQNVQSKLQGVLKNVVTREERKRIQTVVRMLEDWLIQSSVTMDGHTCEKLLAELRRLCVPVERRIHERHVALENLDNTIRTMKRWFENQSMNGLDKTNPKTSRMQLNELRALLDIYEEWYLEQKQCPLSEEEDYSLKTAQIVAQQQALEVAWIAATEGSEFSRVNDLPIAAIRGGRRKKPKPKPRKQKPTDKQIIVDYIEEMSTKLRGSLNAFVTDEERNRFTDLLEETRHWLTECSQYVDPYVYGEKLNRLKEIGIAIENRLAERVVAVKRFKRSLEDYRDLLNRLRAENGSYSPHAINVFLQLQSQLDCYEQWLREQQEYQQQEQRTRSEKLDSQWTTEEIREKHQALHEVWRKLIQTMEHADSEKATGTNESSAFDIWSQDGQKQPNTITIYINGKVSTPNGQKNRYEF